MARLIRPPPQLIQWIDTSNIVPNPLHEIPTYEITDHQVQFETSDLADYLYKITIHPGTHYFKVASTLRVGEFGNVEYNTTFIPAPEMMVAHVDSRIWPIHTCAA